MMDKELISIIIPVYNVSPYILECLESVMKQDYGNIEIIVVNDGSTDNTREKVEELCNKDNRLKLVNQPNQGVSVARNHGLDVAKGKFICFIDGDDWISPNYLSAMYKKIQIEGADIVKCGFKFVNLESGRTRFFNSKEKILSNKEGLENYLCGKNISSSVGAALYRSSLFSDKLRFNPEIKIGEDGQMTLQLLLKANRSCIISSVLYFVRERMGSASRTSILKSEECKILEEVKFPKYLAEEYVSAYRLRVATSLLVKNSFRISKLQYSNLWSEFEYDKINISSARKVLPFKWKVLSNLVCYKYGFYYLVKLLTLFGYKSVF